MLLALIATISASLGNVVSARNQRAELPVIQTNAYGMLYGAGFMLLFAVFRGTSLQFDTSPGYILSLLYLAVFGSVIAFGAYLTLLGSIGLDRAAYVTVLFPVIALLLSTFFEDLSWGIFQLAGVLLILLGNAVVVTKRGAFRLSKDPAGDAVQG
jgi:drug/metabolite transporter (DMT)-like permease